MTDYAIRYIPAHVCIDKGKTELTYRKNWSAGNDTRSVFYTDGSGNKIRFDSIQDAIDVTGFSRKTIFKSLKGKEVQVEGSFEYA